MPPTHDHLSRAATGYRETYRGKDYLTLLPVPTLNADQMQLFTADTCMVRPVESFRADRAIKMLQSSENQSVMSIDFGGGKAVKIPWTVRQDVFVPDTDGITTVLKEGKGENYVPALQQWAAETKAKDIPVALSFGGPLEGTKPLAIANAPALMQALQDQYDGDFAELFPTLAVANNDGQAGIKTAAIAVKKLLIDKGFLTEDAALIFPINGGGFGLAVLKNGILKATEVGHTPAVDALNPHRQTKPCDVNGNKQVCLERICASGAGVSDLWYMLTGENISGIEISRRYQEGNALACELYANSALLFAHGIMGIANLENLLQRPKDAVIVYHGGGFRVPGLMERVTQIITKQIGFTPVFMFTDDISPNACAEGAAIASFYKP